jgi:hypothetical protein
VTLAQGDRVVFYTDGITERLDGQEQMYELDRLVAAADRSGGIPARRRSWRVDRATISPLPPATNPRTTRPWWSSAFPSSDPSSATAAPVAGSIRQTA